MFTRTSSLFLVAALLLLGTCDQKNSTVTEAVDPQSPDAVHCAVDGATTLEPVCRREIAGNVLTIHHPDGGFRRLRIDKDGHSLTAADGSESAQMTAMQGNRITLTIGSDRYDLPAMLSASR